jgi:hypothetical protein
MKIGWQPEDERAENAKCFERQSHKEVLEAVTERRFWKCGAPADHQFHTRDQLHENIIGRI